MQAVQIQSAHIIILSADTDAFVLRIYSWNKLAHRDCLGLWFTGSHKNNYILKYYLPAQSFGENICRILPALHSLTGYDTTSRLGSKKNWLKTASLDFIQKHLYI